ncbi:MAG: 50S ribosomal protein L9 [Dehalococcoidia bacterium]|nr:50S ribosomal protein L9 [Dehalococcoidia bacterium]
MKVIFVEDVHNVAKAGEVKEVADGYARNYLIPKKLAVVATSAAMKNLESHRRAIANKQAKVEAQAGKLAGELQGVTLNFKAKVGTQDRLYGSITSGDIAEKIKEVKGLEIDKRKIELEEPIRTVGSHEVEVRLAKDAIARLSVVVEAE